MLGQTISYYRILEKIGEGGMGLPVVSERQVGVIQTLHRRTTLWADVHRLRQGRQDRAGT